MRIQDKSLIVAEGPAMGFSRHRLLETIRQYAAERLAEAGELDRMRRRHFEHFLEIAERFYADRVSGSPDFELPALAAHRDNIRAALAWGAISDPEGTLRLASALDEFWRMTSAAEGWTWLQRLLPSAPEESPHRLRALLTAGTLAAQVATYAEGTELLLRVVAMARRHGDRVTEAWARVWLGRLALLGEDGPNAREHLQTALALHEQLGNPLGQVRALALLGGLEGANLGRVAEGERKLQAAADLAHEIGDRWGEGLAHMILSMLAADVMDVQRTRLHARTALHISSLGSLLSAALQEVARIEVENDPARALLLLGCAAGHLERTGAALAGFVQRRADDARQRATHLVGEPMATQQFEAGRMMSMAEAIALVDADPEAVAL
jgi:non-specific serine/threonine protein kinase